VSRKKVSTTVYFTPEQLEALQEIHNRTRIPMAVIIREGIDLVLAKYASEVPK